MKHQSFKLGVWLAKESRPAEVPEEVCPAVAHRFAVTELEKAGYVVNQSTLAGHSVAVKEEAAQLVTKRSLRKYRKDEVSLRVLEWVDENPDASKGLGELADSLGEDFTGDFTREEFQAAAKNLREGGYITGIFAGGVEVVRATITRLGEQCLNSGYAPNDFESNKGISTVTKYEANIDGNVGGFQQGDGNTMSVTQNNAIERILDEMRDLVTDEDADVQQNMAAVDALVKSAPKNTGLIRQVVNALAASVGTHLGTRITALGEQLIQQLPGGAS